MTVVKFSDMLKFTGEGHDAPGYVCICAGVFPVQQAWFGEQSECFVGDVSRLLPPTGLFVVKVILGREFEFENFVTYTAWHIDMQLRRHVYVCLLVFLYSSLCSDC